MRPGAAGKCRRRGGGALAGESPESRLEQMFVQRGGELTPARRQVLGMIPEATPFHAEALWRQLRAAHPELGRATVFRTLRLLQDMGLVERVVAPDGERPYRLCLGCLGGHHHHLHCVQCGQDTVVDGEALRGLEDALVRAQAAYGFTPVAHAVELTGRCARCTRTAQAARP
jgi:Fur family ferric uptake transcriptional regulator